MTQDRQLLQAALNSTVVTLEPRRYVIDAPVELPPTTAMVRGQGVGVSEIVLDAPGEAVLVGRNRTQRPLSINNLTLSTTYAIDTGLKLHAPHLFAASRGHSAEAIIENVEVRPAQGYEWTAYARRGIHMINLAGPKIDKFWIAGRFNDLYAHSWNIGGMQVGIDAENCQEAKITNGYIHGAATGVKTNVTSAGGGEGIEVSGNAIINCLDPVSIQGVAAGTYGGFNTPWSVVSRNHLFYLRYAVRQAYRSDVLIHGNSFCCSENRPTSPDWLPFGIYLEFCTTARISDNNWWNPSASHAPAGVGIMAYHCFKVAGWGNTIDPTLKEWMRVQNSSFVQVGVV